MEGNRPVHDLIQSQCRCHSSRPPQPEPLTALLPEQRFAGPQQVAQLAAAAEMRGILPVCGYLANIRQAEPAATSRIQAAQHIPEPAGRRLFCFEDSQGDVRRDGKAGLW